MNCEGSVLAVGRLAAERLADRVGGDSKSLSGDATVSGNSDLSHNCFLSSYVFCSVASDVIVNLGHAWIPHCWREPARLLLCHNVRFASVQNWHGDFLPVPIIHVRPFHVADKIEQGGDALPGFLPLEGRGDESFPSDLVAFARGMRDSNE